MTSTIPHKVLLSSIGKKGSIITSLMIVAAVLFVCSPFSLATAQQQQTTTAEGEEATATPSPPLLPQVQEHQQQQQIMLQKCDNNNSSSGAINDINASGTTTGRIGANNNSNNFLYQNPEYDIQIQCPQSWIYVEGKNPGTGDFLAYFTSLQDAERSRTTGEKVPVISVATRQLPSTNIDLQLFADLNIRDLTSIGDQIISTNLNVTLSGMPAFEVLYADTNGTMFLQDWTIQGDRAYGVVYTSPESRFEQILPIAQDMTSSFTITNVTSDRTIITATPSLTESNDYSNNRATNAAQGPNTFSSSTT